MKRVLVIGCPGAGKSTFARRLRDVTGLPLYYLDMMWHKPDRTTVTREQFDSRLQSILKRDAWIIDGNYARTLPQRLEYCDTVFFLDFPTDICVAGAEQRIGVKREDMPWVEHGFEEEFRQYIAEFPTRQRPQMLCMLAHATSCLGVRVHVLHSRTELKTVLGDICTNMEQKPVGSIPSRSAHHLCNDMHIS